MNRPLLARLELPDRAALLYEKMVLNDPDRSGNWRFFFRDDGCFFNAHNRELFVSDEALTAGDDPALFWNSPFSDTPDRCLTAEQQRELREAVRQTDSASLRDYYPSNALARTSSPTVERWTFVEDAVIRTIIVELQAGPEQLKTLSATIDRLVAAAPRPSAS